MDRKVKKQKMMLSQAPLIGMERLRLGTDGQGVTLLVGFWGCPLRCKYCLNPQCLNRSAKVVSLSPKELYDVAKKDEFYYVATKGGVTFGGGEPLLYGDFIKEVLLCGANKWHTSVETSFNVPTVNLILLKDYVDEFIVDIKDMDSAIYKAYTGKDNSLVFKNIEYICRENLYNKLKVRIPLIPEYNDVDSVKKSQKKLYESGITNVEFLKYRIRYER